MVKTIVHLSRLLDGDLTAVEQHVMSSGCVSVRKELCDVDTGGLGHCLHGEGGTQVGVVGERKGSRHQEIHGVRTVDGGRLPFSSPGSVGKTFSQKKTHEDYLAPHGVWFWFTGIK